MTSRDVMLAIRGTPLQRFKRLQDPAPTIFMGDAIAKRFSSSDRVTDVMLIVSLRAGCGWWETWDLVGERLDDLGISIEDLDEDQFLAIAVAL